LVPSAEEEIPSHVSVGALVNDQVTPKFVEVQIEPPYAPAASLDPSAEDATANPQASAGALVCVQVWLRAGAGKMIWLARPINTRRLAK
jgi:hypothetical protein